MYDYKNMRERVLANSMTQAVEQLLWNCDEHQLSEAADSLSILIARKLQKKG